MIAALGVNVLMWLAVLGLGGCSLKLLGLWDGHRQTDRLCYALPLGFGLLGWFLFFVFLLGAAQPTVLVGLLLCFSLGAAVWKIEPLWTSKFPLGVFGAVLFTALLLIVGMDIFEALPPPTDADSLAYHFERPRQMLESGTLNIFPRAPDGVAPLLVNMTYAPALALGGELGLTFWTMTSTWVLGLVFYLFARRFLEPVWSLSLTLVLLSLPLVVYSGGSGHVETRNALFVIGAAFALTDAKHKENWRFLLVAGLLAGFFAGSKYLGLIFVGALGLVALTSRRGIVHGSLVGGFALLAGFQWYTWNWWSFGDPIFPMLFDVLNLPDGPYWNAENHKDFLAYFPKAEQGAPLTLLWWVYYPVAATFWPEAIFEAGRTGVGIFPLAILPLAAIGIWRKHKNILSHPLFRIGAIAAIYYTVWFFTGSSQRIRHILPIFPLVLLCLGVAAHRGSLWMKSLRPLALAVGVVVSLQLMGALLFSLNAIRYVVSGETRQTFLQRTLSDYVVAEWVNANLGPADKLATFYRYLFFYLDVPYFFVLPIYQTQVDVSPKQHDSEKYLRQLHDQNITHVALSVYPGTEPGETDGFLRLSLQLLEEGQLRVIQKIPSYFRTSRTLPGFDDSSGYEVWIMELSRTNEQTGRQ
ncbi:MAG: hypothetical protein A2516_08840 [Alphaproteobacteria bacterium RIFOXYD12_FULL_60_8]|nr:MAG: hypothetical protein A2516_08840 [Alphaproteobacteria bacterium RIFOXYD12_FULL_60_8]